MEKSKNMIIYNLFPLLAGKFADWEKHIKRAADMGFNWIFVNPVQYTGVSGSLYSIKDYFSFNPLFVNEKSKKTPEEQVKKAISIANDMGVKIMVDLVINHCAIDSDLVKDHPEWFEWEGVGKVSHPFCDENGKRVVWGDLAKFDYQNTKDREGLYNFVFKVVDFLVKLGFSGFRCDAAYQLPPSFWKRLIREIRANNSDVLFFAETLGCSTEQTSKTASAGFDYIFNSSKWWDFHSPWLMEQYDLTREMACSIGFPESHDTARLCEEFNGNIDGIKQRYLFSALFSTGVMMPVGLEFGFRKRLSVVETRAGDWEETDIDLTHFVKKVNEIKSRYKVFQMEAPTEILQNGNPDILVMWKASSEAKEEALIIINKDIHNKQSFYSDNLINFTQKSDHLIDVSPDYPLDYIAAPFQYDLRPGQAIVLMTEGGD